MKTAVFFFTGKVQGVGFRYTTRKMATELGLLGQVKNLKDGRVELQVSGAESALGLLIAQLKETFRITEIEEMPLEANPTWKGFVIAY